MTIRLRILAALVISALQIGVMPDAKAGWWCADYAGEGINCGFYSLQQCLDDISGVGGVCQPNVYEEFRPYRPVGAHRRPHAGAH
jgi:hypothetical protein